MGLLVDGKWRDDWYDTESNDGRFEREASGFRSWITADGAPGPTGSGGFAAESGRYHLYVSYACPWAHRALIVRHIKRLEPHISLSVVHWQMLDEGWTFKSGPGVIPDEVNGVSRLHELYTKAKPDYSGRVTVPVLWDKRQHTIVNNESAEIIRMFNSAFAALPGVSDEDLYPESLADEIDALNDRIYHTVNNGVYKAGFATRQAAYEEAVRELFQTLDWLDDRLTTQRYLTGNTITEADWRLFTTLVRFDPVYVGHFKTNLKRLRDYPALWGYLKDLYQQPGIAETVNLRHIKGHYYQSHETINPNRIVPLGPTLDYSAPHGRDALG